MTGTQELLGVVAPWHPTQLPVLPLHFYRWGVGAVSEQAKWASNVTLSAVLSEVWMALLSHDKTVFVTGCDNTV